MRIGVSVWKGMTLLELSKVSAWKFFKSIGLLLISLAAMVIGACRSQPPLNEDAILIVLTWVVAVGGLLFVSCTTILFHDPHTQVRLLQGENNAIQRPVIR
ncbi:MAG TPA: hypothetical protein DDW21_00040 [Verrucomicrobiales bacterium]|nr:MAG: hypothetical protein B9S37_02680 [Verrucomicrobiae bacterium Tous-C3TDCM]PAZ07289.1 MAG: hypothetical protein CAK88_00870 [Verrucomicrobiae bacterium AMD-G2]HBE21862.1 hypothetical protein [Verrucomicrobiales bacterium]